MDMEREHLRDHTEPHRSQSAASSSWSSDYPAPHHGRNIDCQTNGFSGDAHNRRYSHFHYQNQRHHLKFNNEHLEPVGAGGDDVGSLPPSGRKRQFSQSDNIDVGNYVKLYVGDIPRTATEEEIRAVFEEHGNIVEVVLVKDKRTGQQQEYCFVKYAMLVEADRAIEAFNNQYTFPGGVVPLKVRYAGGKRERVGGSMAHDCKLYVGCLNKQASKGEIEEIFAAYGAVEDVFIVRDELKQSRGCGFVRFSHKDMAVAAINGLNGAYFMRGCDQPLIVRFADPKKPRVGESRDNSKFGASGCGPRFQEPAFRAAPYHSDPLAGHTPNGASNPPNPQMTPPSCLPPPVGCKLQGLTSTTDSVDCDWSEHTCPDGYKYYFNCVTCESRWEKPEEYSHYEKQLQQKQRQQQHCCQEDLCNVQVQPSSPVITATCV